QRGHRDPELAQRRGQAGGHISQASGLHERIKLGNDRENFHVSLSIIGCVIRQTPLSVRRKRLASSSGSSPTTSPEGMRTPRAMMPWLRRTERSISPSGSPTAFSTRE